MSTTTKPVTEIVKTTPHKAQAKDNKPVLLWYNRDMDKQMGKSFFIDELAEVKTHKKD